MCCLIYWFGFIFCAIDSKDLPSKKLQNKKVTTTNGVKKLVESRPSKFVHRVAKINLKESSSTLSVNSVRGSSVNNKPRPGAISSDNSRIRASLRFSNKSPEPVDSKQPCPINLGK